MSDENYWRDQADTWQAKFNTLHDATAPALDKVKAFKSNFGVREHSDGSLSIDYEKMVTAIGPDGALELRSVIDEVYSVSGAAGEKPRIKVKAA